MNFEKKFNRSFEQEPEPLPGEEDGFLDFLPEEIKEDNSKFDTNPEEHLLEEDEVEEIFQEESEHKERVLIPEEIKADAIKINEFIIELKLRIDGIKAEMKKKKDKDRAELKALLEGLSFQYTGLSGMAVDMETGNFDEIIERPVA